MPYFATRKSLLYPYRETVTVATSISTHSTLLGKCISHWTLDETSGNRADSNGSNTLTEAGTTAGVSYATGILGNAADFASADADRLERSDPATLSFADVDFAFSLWVYIDGGGSTRGMIAKGTNTTAANMEYYIAVSNTGSLTFRVSNGTSATTVTSGTTLSTSTWYFIYAYHDSTADELGISVDNGAVTTTSCTHGCWDSTNVFRLARHVTGLYLDGRLDSVSVWNAVLTSGEVTDLYNSGAGLDY